MTDVLVKDDAPFREGTTPLLRQYQVEEDKEELARIDVALGTPYLRRAIANVGHMLQRQRSLREHLRVLTPNAYDAGQLDKAVKREAQLRQEMLADGMPTQEEMRRCPEGAPQKHMRWDRRNKRKLLEWRNIRLRLRESGALESCYDGAEANFEVFRPRGGSHQLPMHGEMIPGKVMSFPSEAYKQNYDAAFGGGQSDDLVASLRAEIAGMKKQIDEIMATKRTAKEKAPPKPRAKTPGDIGG